jgi:alpha-glucosidase
MNMGLSGLTIAGADIGGFAVGATPELYTRWLEAGVFYPYCRTHVEWGAPNQEPWSYGDRIEDINRNSIELRYRLLPYLYNAYRQAALTGLPIMRALLLDYPDDKRAIDQESEFLFGDDLLVAPVVDSDRDQREVYLPRGVWYDHWTDRRYEGPTRVNVDAPLDRIPMFVRGGAIIPTRQVVEYTDQAPINPLTFEIYPDGKSEREYYEDDGISFDYQRGISLVQRVSASETSQGVSISVSARQGSFQPAARALVFKVHAQRVLPRSVELGGKALHAAASVEALESAADGWAFDSLQNVVWIKSPDTGAAMTIQLGK